MFSGLHSVPRYQYVSTPLYFNTFLFSEIVLLAYWPMFSGLHSVPRTTAFLRFFESTMVDSRVRKLLDGVWHGFEDLASYVLCVWWSHCFNCLIVCLDIFVVKYLWPHAYHKLGMPLRVLHSGATTMQQLHEYEAVAETFIQDCQRATYARKGWRRIGLKVPHHGGGGP